MYKVKAFINWLDYMYSIRDKIAYLLGGIGTEITSSLVTSKCNQYAYNQTRRSLLDKIADKGYIGMDCVCLYKVFFFLLGWTVDKVKYDSTYDLNEKGIYAKATVKGTIDKLPEVKGLGLIMDGHFGVYMGNNTVYEITPSTKYATQSHGLGGMCMTKLSDRKWTNWCYLPGIDYTAEVNVGDTVKVSKYCLRPFDNMNIEGTDKGVIKMSLQAKVIAKQSYKDFSNLHAYPLVLDTGSSVVFGREEDII